MSKHDTFCLQDDVAIPAGFACMGCLHVRKIKAAAINEAANALMERTGFTGGPAIEAFGNKVKDLMMNALRKRAAMIEKGEA